jgi:hypothetical protein
MLRSFAGCACSLLLAVAVTIPALAREPVSRVSEAVDVLDAEKQGLVEVKYIPNDSRSAQIVVKNTTKKPLTLRLPAAFAGVPVLAQAFGAAAGGNAGFGAAGANAAPQTAGGGGMGMGGGMPGMGGGMPGMGGGAFSIPPERTRTLRVVTVCLEHGKPEPNPRYPYELAKISAFSSDPQLAAVMESLGRGEISQKVAQAAAWHIANGMSWERLAAEKIDHAGGVPDEPFFSPAELVAAHHVVDAASRVKRANTAAPATTPAAN